MKLFIGNCTKQPHDFIYRLPEDGKTRMQRIQELTQIMLSGDLSSIAIDYIVKQHAQYGLVNVTEIDRTKAFSGLCYSVDKKIPATIMLKLLDHNKEVLVTRGQENRKEAAVAVSNAINDKIGGGLENLEMSVIEDIKGNAEGGLEENIRVTEHTGRDNELVPRNERTGRKSRNRKS